MATQFDYKGAKDAGYSDEEIMGHLSQQNPKFDFESATKAGYSPEEINEHLSTYKPKKTPIEKAGRLATQFGISATETALLPYELSTIPLATQGYHVNENLRRMGEDVEFLHEKNAGKPFEEWDEKDKEHYNYLEERIKNPQKLAEEVKPINIGTRGLLEKTTGLDLHPEGFLEKAVGWLGYTKDPRKAVKLGKEIYKNAGLKVKDLKKVIMPGTKTLSAAGAGFGLQMAEEGHFGPMGTMAVAILGDLIGKAPKATMAIAKNPKYYAAQATNLVTMNNTKRQVAKQLIEDFGEAGLKYDVGTLTQSDIVKMIQARLAQSSLTGDALKNYRKELSGQVKKSYETLADAIGDMKYENNYQGSEAIKNAVKVNDIELNAIPKTPQKEGRSLVGRIAVQERPDYQNNLLNRISPNEFVDDIQAGQNLKTAANDIKQPIQEQFNQRFSQFNEIVDSIPAGNQGQLGRRMQDFVRDNEGSLLLGESAAEYRVVQAAQRLADELLVQGGERAVSLRQLMRTKRTLADIADWEFGGSDFRTAYKNLVGDVDNAIRRELSLQSPELLEMFDQLNAEYSQFKNAFENKNVMPLFEPKNENYAAMYNRFVTNPDKLRALEDILIQDPRGNELINQVKRDFAERITQQPNLTPRDIRNLANILGPEFNEALQEFQIARDYHNAHPEEQAARRERLGLNVQIPQTKPSVNVEGRKITETGTKRASEGARRKYAEFLEGKDANQIMKQMDTVEGIRKLKQVLSTTQEGKQLFKDLARFKLEEMIGKKMEHNMTEQVKFGTFSNLLKTTNDQAIVKELIGEEAFKRLRLIQKNSGKLAESAQKFFNSSQSATVGVDIGVAGTLTTAVLTGNPWLFFSIGGGIWGARLTSNLLADPVYIKYLEEAILTNDPKKYNKILLKMEEPVKRAMQATNSMTGGEPNNE